MESEPTPIADVLGRWLYGRPERRILAEMAVVFGVLAVLGEQLRIQWLMAGAGVGMTMFGAVALAMYGWHRFKRWRYPSYYEDG